MSNTLISGSQKSVFEFRLLQAIKEIKNDYGHDVYIKPKSLTKFGKYESLGTSQSLVSNIGAETMATGNTINRISSSDNGDEQPVVIEGHTVLDGKLTYVVQTVSLDGQNEVILPTPLYRSTILYNNSTNGNGNGAGDFAGTIYVYESGGTVTNGVPQDTTKIHLSAETTDNQSDKCATSISDLDYWIITQVYSEVTRSSNQSRRVEFKVQIRSFNGVWRTRMRLNSSTESSTNSIELNPCLIVPGNSDVRMVATSNGADTEVSGMIAGYLATIL